MDPFEAQLDISMKSVNFLHKIYAWRGREPLSVIDFLCRTPNPTACLPLFVRTDKAAEAKGLWDIPQVWLALNARYEGAALTGHVHVHHALAPRPRELHHPALPARRVLAATLVRLVR